MRVCMLTTSFPRHPDDYAGVFIRTLSRDLSKRGVDVSVVAPHDDHVPYLQDEGRLRVHRFAYAWPRRWQKLAYGAGIPDNLRRRPWLAVQVIPFLAMFLKKACQVCRDCDIVHAHWAPLGWIGLVLRERYRTPIVLTVHGTDVRSLPGLLVKPVLERVDAVIAAARETEVLLQQLSTRQYHTIPLPIDEDRFRPGVDIRVLAEELDLVKGQDVVLFVGRLNAFKDPMTLVKAVPHVLARHPDTVFLVVGDGPQATEVRAAVDGLGLGNVIHMMGARTDVERFLSLSKVFVALSPVENAWSMTIAEAMHMGVPCVITRAGSTEEVFTHLKDVYLVEPGNEEGVAQAICKLLSEEQQGKKLAQGALNLLKQHGKDSDSIARRTMALYEALLKWAPSQT